MQVSHLTDGNGSTVESASNMGMIVGVAVAALAAIAAAAFMMKKVSSPPLIMLHRNDSSVCLFYINSLCYSSLITSFLVSLLQSLSIMTRDASRMESSHHDGITISQISMQTHYPIRMIAQDLMMMMMISIVITILK